MRHTLLAVFLSGFPLVMFAQSADIEVTKYLAMIQNGQTAQVKAEIPALLSKYPNNPAVLYLQAQTTAEGAEAVRIYQSIVDNFPSSAWAPPALFRVYQFYYAIGLYRTAELKMSQLKNSYPDSKFARGDADANTKLLPEEKTQLPVVADSVPVGAHIQTIAKFTLQVGAFTTQANAEKQKTFFEERGYAVELIGRVKENKSLYLVLVGEYTSAEDARAAGVDIKKKHNIDSIITTK